MSKDMRYGLACQMPCKFDEIIAVCTLLTSSCLFGNELKPVREGEKE